MGLADDLKSEVNKVFKEEWQVTDGTVVPENDKMPLNNSGTKLEATVLYSDIVDSTNMVNSLGRNTAAEIYKTFLNCACKIIKSEGGEVTAFDGDRVMAVFIGNSKNTCAVRTALKINWAVIHIINPAYSNVYNQSSFSLKHMTGIDTSELLVARTGMRGSNDLVWVGNSANIAAKLCSIRIQGANTIISKQVYNNIHDSVKKSNGVNIWTEMENNKFFTNYYWSIE